jgi:putative hemolysin
MSRVVLDVIVVLIIILIGGFFAGSEMALVSLREGQVRALAKRGRRGLRAARLAQDPNRFFSAVQIGVTLATLFSGAYGAETLAGFLRSWLIRQHLSPGWASAVGSRCSGRPRWRCWPRRCWTGSPCWPGRWSGC